MDMFLHYVSYQKSNNTLGIRSHSFRLILLLPQWVLGQLFGSLPISILTLHIPSHSTFTHLSQSPSFARVRIDSMKDAESFYSRQP